MVRCWMPADKPPAGPRPVPAPDHLALAAETIDMPLRPGELLARPPGWRPALNSTIAAWIADHLGPVMVVGDGTRASLRMSQADCVAYLLRWR